MNKKDIIITRTFDAPIELVWKAWSNSELMSQWWPPAGFSCPLAKIDFREGGTSLIGMRAPEEMGGGDMYSVMAYTKIVPMEFIEMVVNLADKDGNIVDPISVGMPPEFNKDMRMTVAFKNAGEHKTEMTVTQYDWTISKMFEMAETGLNQSLDKMTEILARG